MKSLLAGILIAVFSLFVQTSHALTIQDGDTLFDKADFTAAASAYEDALKADPNGYDALWRLAKCYSMLGYLEKKRGIGKKHLRQAVGYGRRATAADEGRFEGHLYLAEAMGNLTTAGIGAKERVAFSREIKKEAARAIELEPSHFKAYMILGMWHKRVQQSSSLEKQFAKVLFGGIPESSYAEALANLKKSIELNPDFVKSRYELALVYNALGEKGLAAGEADKAINCSAVNWKDEEMKKEMADLLKRL